MGENSTMCLRSKSFGFKMNREIHLSYVKHFLPLLPFKGKVQLKDPLCQLWVLLDYGLDDGSSNIKPEDRLQHAFFARKIAESSRRLLHDYDLKTRRYIGTTSTKAELAFLMANQVHARPGALIYDPFVGTGSLIVSCAAFGATVWGSDIDIRVLRGDEGNSH